MDHANLLLQKFPAERFTATARFDFSGLEEGDRAGLVVAGMLMAALQVEKSGAGVKIVRTTCRSTREAGSKGQVNTGAEMEEGSITLQRMQVDLRLKVESGGKCSLFYSGDGKQFAELGPEFTAVNALWIGAKVGVFCNAGVGKSSKAYADVDWFRIER